MAHRKFFRRYKQDASDGAKKCPDLFSTDRKLLTEFYKSIEINFTSTKIFDES